jgi:hypothetical protein
MAAGRRVCNGVVADADVRGQVLDLVALLQGPARRELWADLGIRVFDFDELGLQVFAPDRDVWRACQERQLVLITGNRNCEGPDSLAATIDELNTDDSLPVLTIGMPPRVARDRGYAETIADDLLEYLHDLEKVLGTGRLYLPKTAT